MTDNQQARQTWGSREIRRWYAETPSGRKVIWAPTAKEAARRAGVPIDRITPARGMGNRGGR